jgi:hypothetical protein
MNAPNYWSKDEDVIALRMAGEGYPLGEIGLAVNRSGEAVRARLTKHLGFDIHSVPPRAGTPARGATKWGDEDDRTVMRILRAGGTLVDASAAVHRSVEAVRKRVKALRSALVPSSRVVHLARLREDAPRNFRVSPDSERQTIDRNERDCRVHLVDLMRAMGAATLGECKQIYRERYEYADTSSTPAYVPMPIPSLSYVGSTAAMCSGE